MIILNFIISLSKKIYNVILTIINKFIKKKKLILRFFILNIIKLLIMTISFYELIYELKLITLLNYIIKFSQITIYNIRINVHETITYAIIKMKKIYDRNHKLIFFKLKNKIIFKFHKKYII